MPLEIGVFLSIDFGVFFTEDGVIGSFEFLPGVFLPGVPFCDTLGQADFGVTDSEAEWNKTKATRLAKDKWWNAVLDKIYGYVSVCK